MLCRYLPAAFACQISTSVCATGREFSVKDASTHDNAFAEWLAGMLPRQIASFHISNVPFEHRPCNLQKAYEEAPQVAAAEHA